MAQLKYEPQDEAAQKSTLPIETNIGSFLPGQIVSVSDVQMKEAQRLVENGDFTFTDEDENADSTDDATLAGSVKKAAAKVAAAVTPKSKSK